MNDRKNPLHRASYLKIKKALAAVKGLSGEGHYKRMSIKALNLAADYHITRTPLALKQAHLAARDALWHIDSAAKSAELCGRVSTDSVFVHKAVLSAARSTIFNHPNHKQ